MELYTQDECVWVLIYVKYDILYSPLCHHSTINDAYPQKDIDSTRYPSSIYLPKHKIVEHLKSYHPMKEGLMIIKRHSIFPDCYCRIDYFPTDDPLRVYFEF